MNLLCKHTLLLALLACLGLPVLSAQAALLAATAQPNQRQLQVNQDNNFAVNWRVTAGSAHSGGAASSSAPT